MRIENLYLIKLINQELGTEKNSFTLEELNEIKSLNIEEKIDFSELLCLKGILELKLYDLELTNVEIDIISRIESLNSLYLLNCEVQSFSNLVDKELDTLYIYNSSIGDIKILNNLNVVNLFLEDMDTIDLDDISLIRNVESLSLNDTKVLNEYKLIFMDKIVNLAIANTGIDNIDTLVGNDTLKYLVIDEEIFKKNIEVVNVLKSNGVLVVNSMNQPVESYYD